MKNGSLRGDENVTSITLLNVNEAVDVMFREILDMTDAIRTAHASLLLVLYNLRILAPEINAIRGTFTQRVVGLHDCQVEGFASISFEVGSNGAFRRRCTLAESNSALVRVGITDDHPYETRVHDLGQGQLLVPCRGCWT